MPLLRIFLCALPVALLFAAPATAFTPQGGTTPDIVTSVSAPPYLSAGTVLPIEAKFENTPTVGTEALFSVEVSEAWTFHSGDCGFAAAGAGRAEVVANIAQGETLTCMVRFQIAPTYTGVVTIDALAVSFEDQNTANNAAQTTSTVVRLRVNTTSDGFDATPGDGACRHSNDGFPICSLRAAIIEANALPGSQRIELPYSASIYSLTREGVDTEYFGDLDILDATEIVGTRSAGGALPTVGAAFATTPQRVLDINAPGQPVVVRDVALAGVGQAVTGDGGVLRHLGGHLSMQDVDISGGVASNSGGGAFLGDVAALRRVRVFENSALNGSGIALDLPMDTHAAIRESIVRDNIGESASSNGGGLLVVGGDVLIQRSLVSHNHADEGGGIFAAGTLLDVRDSTISTNTATSHGGGVFVAVSELDLRFVTLAYNVAGPGDFTAGLGGGIYLGNTALVRVGNTILVGNDAQTRFTMTPSGPVSSPYAQACFGAPTSLGYNTVQQVSNDSQCSWTAATGDLIDRSAPVLALADNGGFSLTHALAQDAAEVDSAAPDCGGYSFVRFDQRGRTRGSDGNGDGINGCDRGAFEFIAPALITVIKQGTGDGTISSDPAGIHCGETCSAEFPGGTSVTLLPSHAPGSTFSGWSGPCSGTGHCTVTAQSGVTELIANFTHTVLDDEIFGDGFE